jgi:hypothetical protein
VLVVSAAEGGGLGALGPMRGGMGWANSNNSSLITNYSSSYFFEYPLANSTGYFSAFFFILLLTIVETSRLSVFARLRQ